MRLLLALLLTSCGEAQPTMVTSTPLALDFGKVTVGQTHSLPISIEGRTEGTLIITAPFTIDTSTFSAPTTRTVSFRPYSEGSFSGVLEIAGPAGNLEVPIQGEGVRL